MFKSKFVALAATATLAIAPMMVACGGQQETQPSTTETTQTQTTDTTTNSTEVLIGDEELSNTIKEVTEDGTITWGAEGTDKAGNLSAIYLESRMADADNAFATLVLTDIPTGVTISYSGNLTQDAQGNYNLNDTLTNKNIVFTLGDVDPATSEFIMTLDGNTEITLTMADNADTVQAKIDTVLAAQSSENVGENTDTLTADPAAAENKTETPAPEQNN